MSAPLIKVAAGCLVNARGEVLIAQRPVGKIAAGQWEFPGGKIEPGESPREALVRELHEELGVHVETARPLIRVTHAYRERTVVLDTWKISAWRGEPQSREQQAFAWVRPEAINDYPILAADAPIISALRLPDHYVFTPAQIDVGALLAGLTHLPGSALLRLRLPQLNDAAYATLAKSLLPQIHARGLRLILDRAPQMASELGADGWHARADLLRGLSERPELPLCLASCHDANELKRALELGFDAAVFGPVLPTATHPGASGCGWSVAAHEVQNANLPVFLIGGLARDEWPTAQAAYAQGIAGISAYWD